ncbi:hypothetical protein ACMXYN_14300 [Neptuniibacter sp. PT8_73]|uniref:hypothetical protein n=1 Tax=Neptuniibacter sp. PT8_73 TaxID=3398206 RepID=UPI0039F49374
MADNIDQKPGALAKDKDIAGVLDETFYDAYWLLENLLENIYALLIALIIGAFFAYKKGYWSRFIKLFELKDFPRRGEFFIYHQKLKSENEAVTPRDHLVQRSLLGVIEVPNTYGTFNTSGGQIKFIPVSQNKSILQKDAIKFIRKCIVDFSVDLSKAPLSKRSGNSLNSSIENVSSSFIAQGVILNAIYESEPQMVAVTGKVGCGKSTLIHSVGSFFGANNKHLKSKVAFIVIDVRSLLEEKMSLSKSFHSNVSNEMFVSKVMEFIKEKVVEFLCKYKIRGVEKNLTFEEAVSCCYSLGISVIISLDELDHLYTVFARHVLTYRGDPQKMYEERYRLLFRELCEFHRNIPISLPTQVANTLVLLIARKSTVRLIDEVIGGRPIRDSYRIEIEKTDCNTISEIIKRQVDVVISQVGSEDKSHLKALSDKLSKGDLDYDKNIKVSVHGVRHLINAIAKLSDLAQQSGVSGYKLLSGVAANPGLLRLYQYIDGNPDYSQADEGISNIYLVNKDPAANDAGCSLEENEDKQWLFNDHLQSYWLKYFLCQYIVKMHCDNDRQVNFSDVVELFVSKTKETSNHYEESLVKLALLHASKVDHGRLIKFGFDRGVTVIPASRLNYMLDEHIFWDFGYLMVVVEDKWLEFPREIYSEFKKNSNYSVHEFIKNFHKNTKDKKEKFLVYKAVQVLKFYEVLKVGLKYEKKRCNSVYESLENLGVNIDPMDSFYDHLKRSILDFTEKYVGVNSVPIIERTIKDFEEGKSDLEIKLEGIFGYYHELPLRKEICDKMTLYHRNRESFIASNP